MDSIRVPEDEFSGFTRESVVSCDHLVVCLLLSGGSDTGVVSVDSFPSKHLGTDSSPNAGERTRACE